MAPIPAAELVRHAGFVRALAGSLVRDGHEADDVAQEALATAWERPPRSERSLRAWLRTVARNLAWRSGRARVRRKRRERAVARPEAVTFDPAREALLQAVVDEVCALDEPARSIVIWRYYEGLSSARIGERLGMPAPTVRGRLRRALDTLRQRLDARHDGRRRAWSASLIALCGLEPRRVAARAGTVAAALLVAGGGLVAWLSWDEAAPGRARADAPRVEKTALTRTSAAPRPDATPPGTAAAARPPDRDHDLFGEVVDGAGRPVPGARVRAVYMPLRRTETGILDWFEEVDGPATTTAGDGTFRLRLGWGDLVHLHVDATGFAPRVVPKRQAGARVRVVLTPPVTVRVRVHAGARPLAGAAVELRSIDKDGGRFRYRRKARTGADGTAVFADLPGPDFARVFCTASRHVPRRPVTDVYVPEAGAHEVGVEMVAGREVRGTVVDRAERVIEGATVATTWAAPATTAADGTFAIFVGGRAPMLEVSAPGFAPTLVRADFERPLPVVLEPGDTASGHLVTRAGTPVAGARVVVTGFGAYGLCAPQETRSDAAGVFRFAGLARTIRTHTVVVLAAGFGRHLRDFGPAAAGPGAIDLGEIVLRPAGRIEGRVLDAAGRPRADAFVVLRGANADRGGRPAVGLYGAVEKRFTDDLGRFRFPGLAPGTYDVSARAGPTGAVPVESGAVARIDLDERDFRDLRVVVTDESGSPVAGARVRARAGVSSLRADCDARGVAILRVYGDRAEIVVTTGRGFGRAEAGAGDAEITVVVKGAR